VKQVESYTHAKSSALKCWTLFSIDSRDANDPVSSSLSSNFGTTSAAASSPNVAWQNVNWNIARREEKPVHVGHGAWKKVPLLPVTSPHAHRFSKFFYCDSRQQICNKAIVEDSSTRLKRVTYQESSLDQRVCYEFPSVLQHFDSNGIRPVKYYFNYPKDFHFMKGSTW